MATKSASSELSALIDSGQLDDAERLLASAGGQLGIHRPYFAGLVALGRHNYGDAARALREAVGAEPGNYKAIYYLGCALESQGQNDEALRCFKTAGALSADFEPLRRKLQSLGQAPNAKAMTDFQLPATDEELQEYEKRKTAKERVDFKVENWAKYPKGYRAFGIVATVIFGLLFVSVAGFIVFNIWSVASR